MHPANEHGPRPQSSRDTAQSTFIPLLRIAVLMRATSQGGEIRDIPQRELARGPISAPPVVCDACLPGRHACHTTRCLSPTPGGERRGIPH